MIPAYELVTMEMLLFAFAGGFGFGLLVERLVLRPVVDAWRRVARPRGG